MVEIPRDTFNVLSINPEPSAVLVNPTCSIFMYSSSIFNTSVVNIEPIPLNANCEVAAPILPLKVCAIDVNDMGCWVTPSKPIIVFVNAWVMLNLWALPDPLPVNVIAVPDVISSLVGNSWNLFSSIFFTNTVVGRRVVLIPAKLIVEPIDTGVAATPTNVEDSWYVISSLVLKKWLLIVNIPVDFSSPTPSGLNVLVYIGTPWYFKSNLVLFALFPFLPSKVVTNTSCWTLP